MKVYRVSAHAKIRLKQRGQSVELIDLLCTFGREKYVLGAWQIDIGKKELHRIRETRPDLSPQMMNELMRMYAVDKGSLIVMCGYKRRGWGKRFSPGKKAIRTVSAQGQEFLESGEGQ